MQVKNKIFLSLLAAVLLSLSWPERGLTLLIFIAWVPLFLLEEYCHQNKEQKKFRLFGWTYFAILGWNALTTWWVCNASFGGGLFAIFCNSLFMTGVFYAFHIVKKKKGHVWGYAALIIFWVAFEYLHLNWELSWPWLTIGNVFATKPQWIQWYEWTGVLGGSVWVLLVNILITRIFFATAEKLKRSVIYATIAIIFPVLISLLRYNTYNEEENPVNVIATQPNIDPYGEKFSGMSNVDQLIQVLRLANLELYDSSDVILAPETAISNSIWEDEIEHYPEIKLIRNYLQANPGTSIIIGASTNRAYLNGQKPSSTARKFKDQDGYYDSYNTALLFENGRPAQIFHKSKLVPGVEKMPYPKIFGFLEKLSIDMGGTAGSLGVQDEPTVFTTKNGMVVAPVICYESIYGGYLAKYVRKGAQWISIITNDGWWGDTPGYRQHFNYARLQAVSLRRSIGRSANTGISGFINQRGDTFQQTPYWKDAVVRQAINKNNKLTFFAQHGDYPGLIASFLVLPIIVITFFVKRKNQ